MKLFDANLSLKVYSYIQELLLISLSFDNANQIIFNTFGIKSFFSNNNEYNEFQKIINQYQMNSIEEDDRAEYGDFQTNSELTLNVINLLSNRNISPELVIEPTCGKGNFLIAALSCFPSIKVMFGIEIYKPYVWEAKFNIIDFFLSNPTDCIPEINIIHNNVFAFDFNHISNLYSNLNILIIGNPPWVTNSKLGSMNSKNMPKKSNFKNQNGLASITGKGNFDIAEYIILMLLDTFETSNGYFALLVKNSVIKNLIFDQKLKQYKINTIQKFNIDSKKEFNVSVEASLLFFHLNSYPSIVCSDFNFYSKCYNMSFGWSDSKFVSNIEEYKTIQNIDGNCPFEWRQGIKHDCSDIMELEWFDDHYKNKIGDDIYLEKDLVYGLLKSSDLKNTMISNTRKNIIITQTKVGQDTSFIQHQYPETFKYLFKYLPIFNARKSSIYNGKPMFSIFGIGDYSFKPFKVAISGLYKRFHFTLIMPQNDKPIMLDDTCYFIGFDNIEYAFYTLILLNHNKTLDFLKSITFMDAKRVFTKDILMRIDLLKITNIISKNEIEQQLNIFNNEFDLSLTLSQWDSYVKEMTPSKELQMTLFDL